MSSYFATREILEIKFLCSEFLGFISPTSKVHSEDVGQLVAIMLKETADPEANREEATSPLHQGHSLWMVEMGSELETSKGTLGSSWLLSLRFQANQPPAGYLISAEEEDTSSEPKDNGKGL